MLLFDPRRRGGPQFVTKRSIRVWRLRNSLENTQSSVFTQLWAPWMEFHRGSRGFGIFRYGATPLRPSKSLHNWWFWLASAKPSHAENTRSEGGKYEVIFHGVSPACPAPRNPTRCCMPQHRNPLLIFRTHFALFAFRPAHETFARPSDRCHDAYEYCNLPKNSRPS